jgi:hypothetical protein
MLTRAWEGMEEAIEKVDWKSPCFLVVSLERKLLVHGL